ncbi:MAG: heparan-alpha-glucosaminide N-acetyltransferase domain-containing protein, partial [Flavitalea sp.]
MTASQRFLALDVFRGMTVCFMIIVNTPGSGETTFSPLLHAKWHGFTPTDLVFPSFLFAVGNAMSFATKKWETMAQSQVLMKIFKRTFIIFLLGYLMYWFPFVDITADGVHLRPFAKTRVFGVLQRIALCYGFTALMVYYLKPRMILSISAALLILYWAVMIWFGGTPDPLALESNAGTILDRFLLGNDHLYHGEGVAFDPEGLLSTFPAIVNVVGGYFAGRFILLKGKTYEGLSKLLLAGAALLAVAYLWNLEFPVNKKLWTSSFVLLTVGLDCLILGGIIYVVDFLQKTRWTVFFQVFGKNPLFIYLLSEVIAILLYFFHVE